MNKIVTKQLFMMNSSLTGKEEKLGDKQWNALKSAAAAPYTLNENDYYIHKTLAAKAAKLGCELTRLHPFAEKNELTALIAAFTMLEINGCKLAGYKEDINVLKSCFRNNDIESAERWINAHSREAEI